jgi:hypothetical protein
MKKLGIIGAMSVEVEQLKAQLQDISQKTVAGMDFYEGILEGLHKFMAKQYEELNINFASRYVEGVNTPHFLLNFIDYLYWLKKDDKYVITDFNFRYWNSVEHHLAKNYAIDVGVSDDITDCIGNLFLISKSANSRLSDRSVSEKIERFKDRNMGANRQIIHQISKKDGWDEREIKDHYKDLVKLLEDYQTILNLN